MRISIFPRKYRENKCYSSEIVMKNQPRLPDTDTRPDCTLSAGHNSNSQVMTTNLAELRNNQQWIRLYSPAANVYEICTGYGTDTTAILREPVGVRWYQNNGNLPDGERSGVWQKADLSAKDNALWTLYGTITDPNGGTWETETHVKNDIEGFRLTTTFTRRGTPVAASVRVYTTFTAPPVKSFTLIPGSIYNGNRADVVVPRRYCPLLTNFEIQNREKGTKRRLISDIPRQDASTWWTVHLLGYQSASASVSAFNPASYTGIHLGFARTNGNRVTGVIHTTDPDIQLNQVVVENPCVRNLRYRNCGWERSPDKPHVFNNGDTAIIDLRLASVTAPDVPSFVTGWTNERSFRRLGLAPGGLGSLPVTPDLIPRSYASTLAIDWKDRNLWSEKGYYKTIKGSDKHPREIILGWGSGTMDMWPMFAIGNKEVKDRIRATIRFLLNEAQAPGGLYYGVKMDNGTWTSADSNLDYLWAMNAITPRRTTDMVLYGFDLLNALRVENGEGDSALAIQYEASLRRACDALVRVWKTEGEIPFLLNPQTETSVWKGGHAGARAIGCLVRASELWNDSEYLAIATEIARYSVETGLARGETWGGPSDIMQGIADNESLTALAEGLTMLHGVTDNSEHLKWATQAADLLATWMLDEPIFYPAESVLGRNNVQPFGALIANTQNCWGTPGLCVNGGRFLLHLYERTGQTRFMDMLSDIVRVPLQMMMCPGQDWGGILEPGQMTECASFSDVCSELGDAYVSAATWPVNNMLVSEMELPSIYVDGSNVWRLDHLTASVDENRTLAIGNPTAYPAAVKVLWREGAKVSIDLASGETKMIKAPQHK